MAAAPVALPTPDILLVSEAETPSAPVAAPRNSGWPVLTLGLIAGLGLIYWAEVAFGFEHGSAPDIASITAFGGLDETLVLDSGEWWRVFTAPLLHGSLSHYLGNALALLFAGLILERLVGAPWFGALFVIAGLGGAAGSLALNPSQIISVGASGAIVGLLAAAFVCSFTFESGQLRRKMRKVSLRFLVPSLLPALLPLSTAAGGTQVDYGAHIGGAIAGALMGFALSETWPEISPRPAFERLAGGIAIAGTLAAALSFALIAAHYSDYQSLYVARGAVLIPQSELPQSEDDGIARSAQLVDRFPHDPRAHLVRAIYFLQHRNPSDAEHQLRLGLAERDVLSRELPPQVEKSLDLVLAVVLVIEHRKAEARTVAEPVCQGELPLEFLPMRHMLKDQGVCA
ncbi:MAG TPA: rhomboid family intramembrane serine protease [Micropepsaceae bacterium]|nr:rhomboid family intramembrane serine protease [Micropepsaceae bacterium]